MYLITEAYLVSDIFFFNNFFAYVNMERMRTYAVCIEVSRSRIVKKEEQYQVLRPDELPSSADIHGSVGSSSVCIAYTYTLRRRLRTLENRTTQHLYNMEAKKIMPRVNNFNALRDIFVVIL